MIRAATAAGAADLLQEIGAPVDCLWSRSGLPVRARFERESFVPMHLALRFGEDAASSLDAPDFGIWIAKRHGFAITGQFGRAILNAPTLYAAVSVMCSMVTMHNSGARYWLAPDGDSVRLCRRFRTVDGAFRQSDLLTVELLIAVVRTVAGPDWLPSRVEFQSTDPRRVCPPSLLESLATGEVTDGGLATSITFPRALLSRRVPGLDTLPTVAPPSAEWHLRTPPTEFLTSVDLVIESTLGSDPADVAIAARAAGLSVRSFQRRLADAGACYSELVDRVRFRKAMDWLHDPHVKIIEIAFALGYSDPAHFTRAFRRWTSLTPLQYRYVHGLAARQAASGTVTVSLEDGSRDARRRSRTTSRPQETAATRAERCAVPPPGRRGRSRPRAGSRVRMQ
jgi:AraC-like DNA-binding protein